MKLHWSPKSPYVRKVMVAAHELGIVDRLTLVRSVAMMSRLNPTLMADNPLGKIPTLVLDDGTSLYDSRVICEYLDGLAGSKLFPPAGAQRWWAITMQALGDGLLDVLILWRNEREKPDHAQTIAWLEGFAAKVTAALNQLENRAVELAGTPFNIGHISIGCMLSYLDFRFDNLNWRTGRPALAGWHADWCRRPAAITTEIRND
ncbi:MAG: glutathione S-transferase [Gammaproteobacteria bacterium]|nr:glutathione S-transferase [Gammaproteobacteria bacterium]